MAKTQDHKFCMPMPEFGIGDKVYYNGLEDSSMPGIVHNIIYNIRESSWKYHVIFHPEIDRWCYTDELLRKKRIV